MKPKILDFRWFFSNRLLLLCFGDDDFRANSYEFGPTWDADFRKMLFSTIMSVNYRWLFFLDFIGMVRMWRIDLFDWIDFEVYYFVFQEGFALLQGCLAINMVCNVTQQTTYRLVDSWLWISYRQCMRSCQIFYLLEFTLHFLLFINLIFHEKEKKE